LGPFAGSVICGKYEKDIPTESEEEKAPPWFLKANADKEWPQRSSPQAGKRS